MDFLLVLILLSGILNMNVAGQDRQFIQITPDSLADNAIQLTGSIYYHEGNTEGAHRPEYDDSDWEIIEYSWKRPSEFSDDWDGYQWFRMHLNIDSSLYSKPLALVYVSYGARKIWHNGELIDSSGVLTNNPEQFDRGVARGWKTLTFEPGAEHIIVMQTANADTEMFQRRNFSIGSQLAINYPERSRKHAIDAAEFTSGLHWFVIGFTVVFGIVHLLFFAFNPKLTFNLWFSVVCFLYAFGTYANGQWAFFEDIGYMLLLQGLFQSAMVLTYLFLALFMRSVLRLNIPMYFKILAGVVGGVAIWNLTGTMPNVLVLVAVALISIEIFITGYLGIRNKTKGAWIISGGVATFIISIILVIALEMMGYVGEYNQFSFFHLPYLGFGIALVGMSLYQSRHLADLNKSLLQKLDEVRDLSETNLKHEREIREAEINRILLQNENERKTSELEKARSLQLSLLPKSLPEQSGYSICAEMFTASEVGGDYYDFIVKDDGTMIWALGDATGHGTEAGIVAAMTKTLFLSLAPKLQIDDCLRQMSEGLKSTGMRQKYMCLGLLTVQKDKVSWCAAGIPYALVIRSSGNGKVEQLISKGMPLGSVTDYKYQISEATLHPGDIIIAMSDGLNEQMNPSREEFGVERVMEILKANSDQSPDKITAILKQEMDKWRGDLHQQDDVTLVCLKRL